MFDLVIIIAVYAALIIVSFSIGAASARLGQLWRKSRDRTIPASRIPFDSAFPIIDEWASRNRWYLENPLLRRVAEIEHMRLMHSEPSLTVEQNLERVTVAVKQRFPAAFQTLH